MTIGQQEEIDLTLQFELIIWELHFWFLISEHFTEHFEI